MKTIRQAAFGLTLVLFMTGCAAMLQSPVAEQTGRVTFTISGGERTALPSIEQFEKITLSFAPRDGSPAVADQDAMGGSVEVELPLGSWDVTAKAYILETDATPAATAQNTIGYDGTGITGETRFVLEPAGAGKGTLRYSVVVPGDVTLAGSGSQITIEQDGAALEDLDDNGFTDGVHPITGSEGDISVSLDEGRYVARMVLADNTSPDANTAVFLERVVILPGLVTKISFTPDAADFLSPAERAALPDMESVTFAGTSFNSNITVGSLEVSGQDYTLAIEAEDGTETLYFTLGKPAAYTASLGPGAAGIAVFDTFEDGPVAGDELVVIKVDTSSATEGGDVDFTLIVGEPPGKTAVEITVKVTVAAVSRGPGLYVATREDEQEVLNEVKDSSITDLKTALIWLAANAADDTDYVVLIGEDSELSDDYRYTSKEGSSDVKITLRGMDEERKIYWDPDGSGTSTGVFNINSGTTLALGDKVTFDGNSESRSSIHPQVVRLSRGSFFEMLPGAKITNVDGTSVISGDSTVGIRTIILRGGVITNNKTINSVINGSNIRLEMFNGAAITENTIYIPGVPNSLGIAPYILGSRAAVNFSNNVTFIMHGGEISYNSVRGVAFSPDVDNSPNVFDMRGGAIHHNGNDAIPMTNPSGPHYAMAAGVGFFDNYGSFTMTGGEISNNGSEHSTLPYSGIYLGGCLPTDGIPHHNVLNGSVTIKNNKVSVLAHDIYVSTLYLGNNFYSSDPIEVVLTMIVNTASTLPTYWNGKQLLASLPQNGLTIDAAAVAKFDLAGQYYMLYSVSNSAIGCQQLTGYTSQIADGIGNESAGSIVVTKDG